MTRPSARPPAPSALGGLDPGLLASQARSACVESERRRAEVGRLVAGSRACAERSNVLLTRAGPRTLSRG